MDKEKIKEEILAAIYFVMAMVLLMLFYFSVSERPLPQTINLQPKVHYGKS